MMRARVRRLLPRAYKRQAYLFRAVSGHPLTEETDDGGQLQHTRYLRNSYNGAEVFLMGTCHASSGSANSVKEMIKNVKPNTIALELCEGRAQHLRSEGKVQIFNPADFLKLPGSFGQKASVHAAFTLQEILKLFGIDYGEEFRLAMEEGEHLGAKINYIDQNIDVTMREVKNNLSFLEITKFVMDIPQHANRYPALFETPSAVRGMKSIDDLIKSKAVLQQMFQLLEDHFPGALKAILHDRNKHMIEHLRVMKGRIIAVVGLAHVEGMEKLWREAEP